MRKFGYIGKGGGEVQELLAPDKQSVEKFRKAIKEVQRFGGIEENGILDADTIKLMASKRCGVPDKVEDSREYSENDAYSGTNPFHHHHHHHHHHHNKTHDDKNNETHRRSKRYIVASTTWRKRHLTYSLARRSARLGREETMSTFDEALNTWGRYARLSFSPVSETQPSDITFSFGIRDHGDPYPFDGVGNVLAHAFFPGSSREFEGAVHFDDEEDWRIKRGKYEEGVDLYTVALHELGHSLGLSHSPDTGSVMNPYYRGSARDLGEDDISAMYHLYASRRLDDDSMAPERPRRPPHTRPPTSTTTYRPEVTSRTSEATTTKKRIHLQGTWNVPRPSHGCFGSYDTVSLIRNELFIIKDKLLWRLDGPGKIQTSYPVDFHRFFYKLPKSLKKIDAIYQRDHDSKIIIFSGREYWVFDGRDFVNSPRSIREYGLPHYIEKVDAAATRNNTAIIFTDKLFWEYDDIAKRPMHGSPKSITEWGLNGPIDAAMTYSDGMTYFFKDDYFFLYDESKKRMKLHSRRASEYWLGC